MDEMKHTLVVSTDIKIKENENTKVYTFVGANTLPDRSRGKAKNGTPVAGEVLSKKVLDKFASMINDTSKMGGKIGSHRTISLFHDRVYSGDLSLEEAGFVIPGSAQVKEMDKSPGNYELLVDVKVNDFYQPKTYPDYTPEKIHYKIENNVLGLSVEYNNEMHQERVVDIGNEKYTYVTDSDDFRGFGFARPDLIGNTSAVRVKEIMFNQSAADAEIENIKGEQNMEQDAKLKQVEADLVAAQAKLKQHESAEAANMAESKIKEQFAAMESKVKEQVQSMFAGMQVATPAKVKEEQSRSAKVKEVYEPVYAATDKIDFVKFKQRAMDHIESNGAKIKEMMMADGPGFAFEKWQTMEAKVHEGKIVVVPTAKTKDIIDGSSMAEGTYNETNAMFADRYVAGITETFLKEQSLLTAMPKEQHLGGNDRYQWKLWVDYTTVTGTSTLAVDPNTVSVARTTRKFEKMGTRIVEYRDGVEVTDFVQHHSMAAVGDLLGLELERAAQAVTESMNADLFKANGDGTAGWNGFIGLQGVADAATLTALYGKTRSAANQLLDGTAANTYLSASEAISVSVVRSGYEKVLAQGSNLGSIAIVMHPTQCRRLFDSEDAAIRNNILTMSGAPASFGFARAIVPHLDGIPIIRDYRCESSAAAADMFAVVDLSMDKGFVLVVSRPLGARGLAKVGTSESAYVNFFGAAVYKAPRNVFVHTGLLTT